jgi:hypothetical protein
LKSQAAKSASLIFFMLLLPQMDRPRNRRQLEVMRDELARSLHLRPDDLKVGNHDLLLPTTGTP